MKSEVVILGGGGREHALGWKLSQSPHVEGVHFAPGNAGTQVDWANLSLEGELSPDMLPTIADFATNQDAFAVVSTDEMLAAGAVDYLASRGVPTFGPTKRAARLESSKSWAAEFKRGHKIPSPEEADFDNIKAARNYVRYKGWGEIVIKADGPAKGKSAIVPGSAKEADKALYKNLVEKQFGKASERVVIQERLQGAELSWFTLSDGTRGLTLPSLHDYKRLKDGNKGPNTGGMGAYGPASISPEFAEVIEQEIVRPTIEGMAEAGHSFRCVLYTGLMLTNEGPKVIEYNARFGDPEAQAQMLLLDEDLYPRMWQAAHGELADEPIRVRPGHAVTVALAAPGYPDNPTIGSIIHGLDKVPEDVHIFHAGTVRGEDGFIKTAGGRALHVAAYGETLAIARDSVYKTIGDHAIHFTGMQYRRRIAKI